MSRVKTNLVNVPKVEAKSILETKSLTKRFGTLVAVDQVSISIAPGEMFGLVGPNGAGKTTVIKMLTTLLAPTSGDAWVAGYDVSWSLSSG